MAKKPMKTTVVSFLLDETGSMESIRDDTIGGFNTYVESLQKDKADYEFTLVKFDSNKTEKVCVGVPMGEVPKLTYDNYVPGAATPLIDAAVKLIKATEKVVKKRKVNVLVAIQTDGHENASTEYTNKDLARLIKEKTAEGWTFVYLGAGVDVFDHASSIGIAAASTMSYGRAHSNETFAAMAKNTGAYARTGLSASTHFTPQQRSSSGDVWHGGHTGASPAKQKARKARADYKARKSSMVEDMDLTK